MSDYAPNTSLSTDTKIILSPLRAESKSLDHRTANADHVARIRRELCDRHWTMLYVATFIVVAACLLRIGGPSDVSLVWPHIRLPEMCASRAIFGIECPGCGLTRSFVALASGDFAASLQFHRLGWLLALAVVAQFPYRAYALRRMRSGIVAHRWPVWFGYFLIAALLVNWLLKVCGV